MGQAKRTNLAAQQAYLKRQAKAVGLWAFRFTLILAFLFGAAVATSLLLLTLL